MWIGECVDVWVDMCTDVCADMCMDTCMDMCMDMYGHVCTHPAGALPARPIQSRRRGRYRAAGEADIEPPARPI